MSRRFLFLHGWPNRRPVDHWQWWATEQLRRDGEQVLYPQLPSPDKPSREAWVELVTAELLQLGTGERIVIAHSLSALLWLHLAPQLRREQWVSRVLLVAPPGPDVVAGLPVAEFAELAGVQREDLVAASGGLSVVASNNDPYCPAGARNMLDRLGLHDVPVQILEGQAHLDPDAGYGSWPSLVAWCKDASAPLSSRD